MQPNPVLQEVEPEPEPAKTEAAVNILRRTGIENHMNVEVSQLLLLKIEDKKKYEDTVTYVYAGSDSAAVHKPITVYKEKNASTYLVAGRYAGVSETHLKYKPLSEEERKIVVEKLGTGKIVRFLSNEPLTVA